MNPSRVVLAFHITDSCFKLYSKATDPETFFTRYVQNSARQKYCQTQSSHSMMNKQSDFFSWEVLLKSGTEI